MQIPVRPTTGSVAVKGHSAEKKDTWTEADIPLEAPAGCRIFSRDYDEFRQHLLGREVKPARFSQEDLEKAGYKSWKQYQLHCSLGNT